MKTKTNVKRQNPEAKAVKKPNWKPASILGKVSRPDGYRVRWCHDTPQNISKKKAEGWQIYNKMDFPNMDNTEYDLRISDSEGLTKTILKRNECIAMIMPEEVAREREEYFRQETNNLTQQALTGEEVKKLIRKGDPRNEKNVISVHPTNVSVIE